MTKLINSNWKKLSKKINYKKDAKKVLEKGIEKELNKNSNETLSPVSETKDNEISQLGNNQKIGKYLGMDCEMVGVGDGGLISALARCSIINYNGMVVYDEYCNPMEPIKDYRTIISGITPSLLKERGKSFKTVQKEVADLIKDKIIVGHALKNDLQALMLQHPGKLIRDTAKYKPLKNQKTNHAQSLKNLAKTYLNKDIQGGMHSSVEDARCAMEIYKLHKKDWDQSIFKREKISLKPHSW
jgi:RNA exonuclease 4